MINGGVLRCDDMVNYHDLVFSDPDEMLNYGALEFV